MTYPIAYIGEGQQLGQQNRRQWEHILGRTLLNMGLQGEHTLFLSQLTVKIGRYGKPYLEERSEVQLNISHYGGLAVYALRNRTVGLDVEVIRPFSEQLVRKMLMEEELASLGGQEMTLELFFRYWILKESCLKVRRIGLTASMREISFFWRADRNVGSSSGECVFYQECLWGKHLITVCMIGDSDGNEGEKERASDDIPRDF